MSRATVKDDYSRPCVTDFGSLTQLTNDFDATFHGSVVKLVSLAVASVPVPGGGSGTTPDPSGAVLDRTSTSPSATPGSSLAPSGVDPGSGTGQTVADPSNGVRDAVNRDSLASDPGGTSPATSETAGPGDGRGAPVAGELPFTGYAAMLTAGVGAALAGTGAALRSRMRRHRA